MTTTIGFKSFEHMPRWRPEATAQAATSGGMCVAYDKRNNATKHPLVYLLRAGTAFDCFNPSSGYGDWLPLATPGLTGTFGVGSACIFHPSQGPRGTLAAGATTTTVTLTTALPAAVGVNQLANRGDGLGFVIRIMTNTALASGKCEERRIISNTSGTTPTLTLDIALSSAPALGASYEILSGRVFLLAGGVLAAGMWKYYDIATNSYSASLATTGLPTTINLDSSMVALSESHVPYIASPGEGFVVGAGTSDGKNCIQATAATGTTITGAGMFADLQTNEYRNFQVRIVEDTITPTSVGQRRAVTSHTSGATGIFTVPTFTVTPSASAKFVIENNDDLILMRSSGSANTFTYVISGNTWNTTTFAAAVANGAGVTFEQSFGITRDVGTNSRHSFLFSIRGGASSAMDVLDIAAAATGTWSNAFIYGNLSQTFTTGTVSAYDPITNQGRFIHINVSGTSRMLRFDVKNRFMDTGLYLPALQGVAIVGDKLFISTFIDGASKLARLYQMLQSSAQVVSMVLPQ